MTCWLCYECSRVSLKDLTMCVGFILTQLLPLDEQYFECSCFIGLVVGISINLKVIAYFELAEGWI